MMQLSSVLHSRCPIYFLTLRKKTMGKHRSWTRFFRILLAYADGQIIKNNNKLACMILGIAVETERKKKERKKKKPSLSQKGSLPNPRSLRGESLMRIAMNLSFFSSLNLQGNHLINWLNWFHQHSTFNLLLPILIHQMQALIKETVLLHSSNGCKVRSS